MKKPKPIYKSDACACCGHPLSDTDNFCPYCGQKNDLKRLALNDFIADFVANLYSIESKIPYTIRSLFTKPGRAAKEFTAGKKAFYANPFRFYLSVTLIYFLLSGLFDKFNTFQDTANDTNPKGLANKEIKAPENVAFSVNVDTAKIPETKKYTEEELSQFGLFMSAIHRLEMYQNFIDKPSNDLLSDAQGLDSLGHANNRSNLFLYDRARKINGMKEKDSRYAFLDYLKSNMPLILFLTLPFFGLAFWLLYYRKKKTFAEHLVFVFYTASYFSIWLLILLLIKEFTGIDLNWLLGLIFPVYLFLSLRKFYEQKFFITITKMILLLILLSIQAGISTLFVLFIAFVTY
ncbi:MAG: DUF3667 domain-containing protein [Flavobacteriaceae bacterium]|nr:DUF3667 domain-containing protein [Flavobacteriaceae bacterium]